MQAEDALSEHFDGLLQNRVAAEVGLLIGKPSVGSRDIVLAVVPHPDCDEVLAVGAGSAAAGSKSKKGGSSSSSGPSVSVSVRHDDVTDHALQASRMLPGGLSVLGLYLFAPDSGFSSASSSLCKALASIASDLAALSSSPQQQRPNSGSTKAAPEQQELLLLHVDSTSRKFTMRSCLASHGEHAAAASLKPCELKFGPSLASLVCLRSSHSFDLALPATDASATLQQLLQAAVAQESARVSAALAVVGGSIPASSTQPLADLLPASSSGVTGGGSSISDPVRVELYCSPAGNVPPPAAAAGAAATAAGSVRLQGTVEAIAYVHRRDAAAKALSELKQDITRSLTARMQLLENEVVSAAYEAQQAAGQQGGSSKALAGPAHPLLAAACASSKVSRGLLRRVLMPWESLGGIQVCDYLMEGDTAEAAVEQARQLLGLDSLSVSQVVAAEAPAVLRVPAKGPTAGGGGAGSSGGCGNAVVAAAAAGAAAVVGVALAYLNLGQQ